MKELEGGIRGSGNSVGTDFEWLLSDGFPNKTVGSLPEELLRLRPEHIAHRMALERMRK